MLSQAGVVVFDNLVKHDDAAGWPRSEAHMRIKNHTRWSTADIVAMIRRVADEELDPEQLRFITVEVFHKGANGARNDRRIRRVGPLGAGLRFNRFNLTLPMVRPNVMKLPTESRDRFIAGKVRRGWIGVQLAHEMAECRGKMHAEMKTGKYGWGGRRHTWGKHWETALADLPLRWMPPAPKPPTDLNAVRSRKREHAEAMVQAWERRLKLATTKLKVWRRRVRRYETKAASAPERTLAAVKQ